MNFVETNFKPIRLFFIYYITICSALTNSPDTNIDDTSSMTQNNGLANHYLSQENQGFLSEEYDLAILDFDIEPWSMNRLSLLVKLGLLEQGYLNKEIEIENEIIVEDDNFSLETEIDSEEVFEFNQTKDNNSTNMLYGDDKLYDYQPYTTNFSGTSDQQHQDLQRAKSTPNTSITHVFIIISKQYQNTFNI